MSDCNNHTNNCELCCPQLPNVSLDQAVVRSDGEHRFAGKCAEPHPLC